MPGFLTFLMLSLSGYKKKPGDRFLDVCRENYNKHSSSFSLSAEGRAVKNRNKMTRLRLGSAFFALFLSIICGFGQIPHFPNLLFNSALYEGIQWRSIGPFRGGRSVAVTGVTGNPMVYYMGATGGGVWKSEDAGLSWNNISDGFFKTGSVGAIAVSESDPNIIYVGMGEHAVRGVMSSHGDGVYKSLDGGKSWKYLGLPASRHISAVRIHPRDPETVFVAVQGAAHGPSEERGVYKSTDGGAGWRKVLYFDEFTGACDLSMDRHNPRILYAGMWDHLRYPWKVRSGGPGSGIYKSTDGGESWEKLLVGLPSGMGKVAVDVSPANPQVVYANIEAEKGGVFRSDDGGLTWRQTNRGRVTIARAWYYTEIVADPKDSETVYVLNAPLLKSIDGGRTFESIPNPHTDQHDLWINPDDPKNLILANDGGACVTFNGGRSWSTQENQPTGQFYRVIADNRFPYHIYGSQQDNSTIAVPSRTAGPGIGWKDWYEVAGGESAFIAFDPDDPQVIYSSEIQGHIYRYDHHTGKTKTVMAYPAIGLGTNPEDMKYRFNWNAPVVAAPKDPRIIYHAANVVLKTIDGGLSWQEISPDLTRNQKEKQGPGGGPYTNEGAGGENYNTISYLACSPHEAETIWAGTDDGLVHLTHSEGKEWKDVTPQGIGEALISSIEVSPHDPAAAYVVATRYKFNDFTPLVFFTDNYGKSWRKIVEGIAAEDFVRVVREDPVQPGLLYGGTETGLYISFDNGRKWHRFQLNLPVCPISDLVIHDNDLIAATSGRAFWILDDLGAIQQSMGRLGNGHAVLFRPKATVKLDAPSQEVPSYGKNPLTGLIIDYYLPRAPDTAEVRLEIVDSGGQVIRTYSSNPPSDPAPYPGGPPPSKALPAKRGINRFNWDLRREPAPEVSGVFVFGDYRGSLVAPGRYSIRLITPNGTLTQQCEILPDPRIEASDEDFAAQQRVLVQIEEAVRDIHQAVNRMREIKEQLESLGAALAKTNSFADLADSCSAIVEKIDRWEENLIQPRQETFQDVINFPNQLNSELLYLRQQIDSHDPRVTEGARLRLNDLLAEWRSLRKCMIQIIDQDVTGFNRLYRQREAPALVVPGDPPPD
jgi:photosystem II stability/assembly factor-like uncharacterized protein